MAKKKKKNGQSIHIFPVLSNTLLRFSCLLIFLSGSICEQQQSLDFISTNSSDVECRPVDIQLYTWSGPGFQSGECWHQGHRFAHGAQWGRIDIPGSPYCVCEQGKVRIFYSQKQDATMAEPLTILRPTNNTLPATHDLTKWPISNYPTTRQRIVLCSSSRLGIRIRSRDGCVMCKCSDNGHWLCRRPVPITKNQTIDNQQAIVSKDYPYAHMDTYHVNLSITTLRIRPTCSLSSTPKFCILIERVSSSNISRYLEIPRETSWIDRDACTRCSCTLDGQLQCDYLHSSCTRPCLLHKKNPIPMTYYFSSGSKWLTLPTDQCRSCTCNNGQRKYLDCDQIVKIDVNTISNLHSRSSSSIGEYRLPSKFIQATPCVLELNSNSHRLIYPGQQTWFEQRCYFCSIHGDQLIRC